MMDGSGRGEARSAGLRDERGSGRASREFRNGNAAHDALCPRSSRGGPAFGLQLQLSRERNSRCRRRFRRNRDRLERRSRRYGRSDGRAPAPTLARVRVGLHPACNSTPSSTIRGTDRDRSGRHGSPPTRSARGRDGVVRRVFIRPGRERFPRLGITPYCGWPRPSL
jgi:hypothetical protein